ncbi:MAG: glycerophosphodiester phosphodiesterase family protein [Xenococcaceae cyanobacterium MO_188.B19]|nr:glycerophosphodiester phosphodiesterase family protein [Xenococcaceae cyanobacterium MO_188.B19]
MAKVKTIAHRGHQGFYPDNCLEGIEHAIKNGSNHLELDVAKTTDDRLILAHWALNLNSTNILDYCKPNDPNDMCSGKYREDTINKAIARFCNGSKQDQRCIVARKLQKIVKGEKRISLHVGKFKLKELQPKLSLDYEKDYIEFLGKGTSKGYLYPFRATHGNSLKEKPTIPTLEEVIEKIVKTINSNKNKIGKVTIVLDLKAHPFIYDNVKKFNDGWQKMADKLMQLIKDMRNISDNKFRRTFRNKVKILYFSRTHQLLEYLHRVYKVSRRNLGLTLVSEREGYQLELLLGSDPSLIDGKMREILHTPIVDTLKNKPELSHYIGIIAGDHTLTKQDIDFIRRPTWKKCPMQVVWWSREEGRSPFRDELHPSHPDHAKAYEDYKHQLECAILRGFTYLLGDYDGVARKALAELGYI